MYCRCISKYHKCDGDYDCVDQSDERPEDCDKKTCDDKHFKCDQTRCILDEWKCDGDQDCRDGTDEQMCKPQSCQKDEFT